MANTTTQNISRGGFEWKSKMEILGFPLVHVALGRDEKTGKLLVAKGIIAIGQFAVGIIAIGQFVIGLLFGLAQFAIGTYVVAQFALGVVFGLGQFATGQTAIGQLAMGDYILCQAGYGQHVWSLADKDPQAIEYFKHLLR